jgi:hypothetical protein
VISRVPVLAFSAEMRVEYRSMVKASLESSYAGGAGFSLVTWAGIWPVLGPEPLKTAGQSRRERAK